MIASRLVGQMLLYGGKVVQTSASKPDRRRQQPKAYPTLDCPLGNVELVRYFLLVRIFSKKPYLFLDPRTTGLIHRT